MKNRILLIWIAVIGVFFSVGGIHAQNTKPMQENTDMMAMMQKSPHHLMMVAYRQNALNFAKTLREMASGGKLEDVTLVRNALGELQRSVKKADEIHQSQMKKMSAEMLEKMKPMMEKMQAEHKAVNEHLVALEKALQTKTPNAAEVEKHAAELVSQFEKMNMTMPGQKMNMPGKN